MKDEHSVVMSVVFPCLSAFLYLVLMFVMAWLPRGLKIIPLQEYPVLGDIIYDGFVALVLGVMFLIWRHGKTLPEKIRFSCFGWIVLIIVFLIMYATGEAFGNWLRLVAPYGLTGSYTYMDDTDFIMYIVMSLTVGPLSEELLCRWAIYGHMRGRFGFAVSFVVSSLYFALCHGTIMHIPVALGLSLFVCVFYEVTGRFSWCVFFHWLFNFFCMTLVFSVQGPSVAFFIAGWVAVMILMMAAYVFRDRVFGIWLRAGSLEQFEAYLEYQKEHIGGTGGDDKSE